MPMSGYSYGGYPATGGYYAPPVPDNLAQLRGAYQPQVQMPTQPVPQNPQVVSNGILWVQGEEGAKAWLCAPGSTVLLMDSDGSSFYLKTVDASGMPQPLRVFDYKERIKTAGDAAQAPIAQNSEYPTRKEFEELVADVAALKAEKITKSKKTSTVKEEVEDA